LKNNLNKLVAPGLSGYPDGFLLEVTISFVAPSLSGCPDGLQLGVAINFVAPSLSGCPDGLQLGVANSTAVPGFENKFGLFSWDNFSELELKATILKK